MRLARCWNCGAEPRWQCERCGSTERRPGNKGCAECHRRYQRSRRPPSDDSDIPLTPAMLAYLAAFDAWLADRSAANRRARARALERLEEPL